jgi:hypothetical protein
MNYQAVQVLQQNGCSVAYDNENLWSLSMPPTAYHSNAYGSYEFKSNTAQLVTPYSKIKQFTRTCKKPYLQSIRSQLQRLRTCIPNIPNEIKPTKFNTLKLAIEYIQYLTDLLDNCPTCNVGRGSSPSESVQTNIRGN